MERNASASASSISARFGKLVSRAKSSSEVKGARARAATMRSAQSSSSPSSFRNGALAILSPSFRGTQSVNPESRDSGFVAAATPRNDGKTATPSDMPIGASGRNDDGETTATSLDLPIGASRNDD